LAARGFRKTLYVSDLCASHFNDHDRDHESANGR
jgi:hypothetical protein